MCIFLRRTYVHWIQLTVLAGSLLLSAVVSADPNTPPVPLKRVVLFSSGVAFFEHEGEVDGTQRVDFQFKANDVKDLLKSIVVQDLSGGSVSTVTYSPPEPLVRTLKAFAVDVTESPSLADLLQQLRGHRVRVDAPNPIEGAIVSVERRNRLVGADQILPEQFLVLKTATGLRRLPIDGIVETKLLDEKLDRELQKALDLLASVDGQDHKPVTFEFRGKGKRTVRISYIQEFPIWKTSYRLVLKDGERPFLQGWAILENTSEQDWANVDLGLVSGRPISFTMDLYQSLYVTRPVVVPEYYASVESRTHDQDLAQQENELRALAGATGRRSGRESQRNHAGAGSGGGGMGGGGFGGGAMGGFPGSGMPGGMPGMATPGQGQAPADRFNLQKGVASAATTADLGELFRYTIATPVSLPRQRSAMLPIVNESVNGEKLFLYNPDVHAKHPLCALRLQNTTKLHLMQGPITVFDGGEYAGDARIEDIPPNSSRLVTFALDLDTEIAVEQPARPDELVSVKIVNGALFARHKLTRSQHYVVKNAGDADKTVVIEQPFDSNWKLTKPIEPQEKTRDLYRFHVPAQPGKPATLDVEEVQLSERSFGVTELDDTTAHLFLTSKVVSPEIQKALRDVATHRQTLANASAHKTNLEKQFAGSITEQARVRENMLQLDKTSELYRRYHQKLGKLEDQLDELKIKLEQAQVDETNQRNTYNKFIAELTIP